MPLNIEALVRAFVDQLGDYKRRRRLYFGQHAAIAQRLPTDPTPATQFRLDLQALMNPERNSILRAFLVNGRRMAERAYLPRAVRDIDDALRALDKPRVVPDIPRIVPDIPRIVPDVPRVMPIAPPLVPPQPPPRRARSFGIVFVAAQPTDSDNVDAGSALRQISDTLRASKDRDRIEISEIKTAASAGQIRRLLDEGEGDILHFSGPGKTGGILVLEGRDGTSVDVEAHLFARILRLANSNRRRNRISPYRIVVLNACCSADLAKLLVDEGLVEAALGAEMPMHNDVAVAFCTGFYGALADGYPIDEAHEAGQVQVELRPAAQEDEQPAEYRLFLKAVAE